MWGQWDRSPPGRTRQQRREATLAGQRRRLWQVNGGDETNAHQGGADETPGSDWDLEETETQEAERAHIVSRSEAGSLGDHGRSRASGSQDESGDYMGHGRFGVSVSNGGKFPPRKFLGNSTTSRGHSGGANVKGHSGGAGSRGRSESAKLDRTHGEGELGGTSGDELCGLELLKFQATQLLVV